MAPIGRYVTGRTIAKLRLRSNRGPGPALRYGPIRQAAACLTAIVEDIAARDGDTRLVIEQDDSVDGSGSTKMMQ